MIGPHELSHLSRQWTTALRRAASGQRNASAAISAAFTSGMSGVWARWLHACQAASKAASSFAVSLHISRTRRTLRGMRPGGPTAALAAVSSTEAISSARREIGTSARTMTRTNATKWLAAKSANGPAHHAIPSPTSGSRRGTVRRGADFKARHRAAAWAGRVTAGSRLAAAAILQTVRACGYIGLSRLVMRVNQDVLPPTRRANWMLVSPSGTSASARALRAPRGRNRPRRNLRHAGTTSALRAFFMPAISTPFAGMMIEDCLDRPGTDQPCGA